MWTRVFIWALTALLVVLPAIAATHTHSGFSALDCAVCYVGHLPVESPSATAELPPPDSVEWKAPPTPATPVLELVLWTGPSRAPPETL